MTSNMIADEPSARLKQIQQLMQTELVGCLEYYKATTPAHLFQAIAYALLQPGKCLRSLLVFESAKIFDISQPHILPIALSVECMHCYSLIHDDLPCMDNADLRRGQPTVHKKFDQVTALLAGNALLTIAIDIINRTEQYTPAQKVELTAMLLASSGPAGMLGGQILDIAGESQTYDINQVRQTQLMKTGCLIKFSLIAPTVIATNINREILENPGQDIKTVLDRYADDFGLSYQIADDLADTELTSEQAGKSVGRDAVKGKSTFVSLLGREGARQELDRLVAKIENDLQHLGPQATSLLWVARKLLNR